MVQHAHYANKKLSTEWGEMVCDAEGCLDIKADQKSFFCDILQFKPVGPAPKEKPSKQVAPPKGDDGGDEDVVKPVDKDRQSRFSKRVKGEDND